MNIINRGQSNSVIFTLTERATLSSPYYLVKMTSRAGRNTKRFILPADASTATDRYNQFTIQETSGSETLTSAIVTLTPAGFWEYEIYEQSSASNLNELNSDNTTPLEKGLIYVRTEDTNNNFYSTSTENTFYP